MKRPIPQEISKRLSDWNKIAIFLRATYIALGLIGVLSPLFVATFADAMVTWQVRALSFAASASVGIFAAFDIGNLTTRWREAWKHLNAACLDYAAGVIEADALNKAYREGEDIIGKMKADLFSEMKKEKVDKGKHH
ncbi:MAG: hypothetical protein QOD40_656 [Alphaproteobacteria bacterium]|jgi:hypothetical protein|nr:hypothetical protein [Alphaproteobacteria bacterium]